MLQTLVILNLSSIKLIYYTDADGVNGILRNATIAASFKYLKQFLGITHNDIN